MGGKEASGWSYRTILRMKVTRKRAMVKTPRKLSVMPKIATNYEI